MKIKVCGMCEPENIAAIARLQPDYMGFIFYKDSLRYAGNLSLEHIRSVPPQTKCVGVFVDAPLDVIRSIAGKFRLDAIQLHGNEPPELCVELRKSHEVIKAFGIADATDLARTEDYAGTCELFLFDTKTASCGGSGQKFDHKVLRFYNGSTPYFISGGISSEDSLLPFLGDTRCCGLDINSRFELSPGIKDPQKVQHFIQLIRTNK